MTIRPRVRALRDEYRGIAFGMPRPRGAEAVEKDQSRMAEIVEALAELGADLVPRPEDLPPEVG